MLLAHSRFFLGNDNADTYLNKNNGNKGSTCSVANRMGQEYITGQFSQGEYARLAGMRQACSVGEVDVFECS
jgi:hypothetical protein